MVVLFVHLDTSIKVQHALLVQLQTVLVVQMLPLAHFVKMAIIWQVQQLVPNVQLELLNVQVLVSLSVVLLVTHQLIRVMVHLIVFLALLLVKHAPVILKNVIVV